MTTVDWTWCWWRSESRCLDLIWRNLFWTFGNSPTIKAGFEGHQTSETEPHCCPAELKDLWKDTMSSNATFVYQMFVPSLETGNREDKRFMNLDCPHENNDAFSICQRLCLSSLNQNYTQVLETSKQCWVFNNLDFCETSDFNGIFRHAPPPKKRQPCD